MKFLAYRLYVIAETKASSSMYHVLITVELAITIITQLGEQKEASKRQLQQVPCMLISTLEHNEFQRTVVFYCLFKTIATQCHAI